MQKTKTPIILVLALTAIVALWAGANPWVIYRLEEGAATFNTVEVSGAQSLAPLSPILIALIMIAAGLMIVNRVFRVVLGLLAALFGVWISWVVMSFMRGDEAAALAFGSAQIAEATGLTASGNVTVVQSFTVTVWPLAVLILGIVTILAGIFVAVFGPRWKASGRKYETRGSKAKTPGFQTDRISDWDALSDGDDPSDWEDTPRG